MGDIAEVAHGGRDAAETSPGRSQRQAGPTPAFFTMRPRRDPLEIGLRHPVTMEREGVEAAEAMTDHRRLTLQKLGSLTAQTAGGSRPKLEPPLAGRWL